MTDKAKPEERAPTPLEMLRAPFPAHQISKLPKQSKDMTEAVKKDRSLGVNCKVCGGWHHKNAVHLDYVGHAALTDRLLDCDPQWSWEPVSFDANGLPARDATGGLWIRLTVAGVTRLGYGHADGKSGGDAVKEAIGDALRNAAMRFGAALDLWHKGDLHLPDGDGETEAPQLEVKAASPTLNDRADLVCRALNDATERTALEAVWAKASKLCAELSTADPDKLDAVTKLYERRRAEIIGGVDASTPFDEAA